MHSAAAVLLLGTASALAQSSNLLGTVDLPGDVIYARSSPDGSKVLVQLQVKAGTSRLLQIVDVSDPGKPRAAGALSVPPYGALAVSTDGRMALVSAPSQPSVGREEITREIVAIDLTRADEPSVLWRETVMARSVAISSRANAFAYSRRANGASDKWETVVVSATDRRIRAVVQDQAHTDGNMFLSPLGTVLARVGRYGDWQLWDLRTATPSEFRRSAVGYGFFRDFCHVFALDSGFLAVGDTDPSRLNVYRATEDVPRVAALELDANTVGCAPPIPGTNATAFMVGDGLGGLLGLDLASPAEPSVTGRWRLPPGAIPIAWSGDKVFATAVGPPRLSIFRLSASLDVVDWGALHATYRATMEKLSTAKRERQAGAEFTAKWNAARELELAGIAGALEAPLHGIAPRQAAAMLNDYGYLVSPSSTVAERALRRAIAVDPRRGVAYLNLADVLRANLSRFAAGGGDFASRLAEIEALYRTYLSLGGRATPSIQRFLRGDPGKGLRDDCEAIAAWTNEDRLSEIVSDAGFGVPWKGRRLDLWFTTEGTARVPTYYAFDSADDRPLAVEDAPDLAQVPEQLWGGDQLGLLTLRGAHYVLHYRDWQHPVAATRLDKAASCRFKVRTKERIGPKATDRAMCAAVQAGTAGPTLKFDGAPTMDYATSSKVWRESGMQGTREVDFANDGAPEAVAQMELSSSAGPGCAAVFFDLLSPDGSGFADGPKRDLLLELQGMSKPGSGGPPAKCGTLGRFFLRRGQTYFESRSIDWPPIDRWSQHHRVAVVKDGGVSEVCDFRFESSVSVQHLTEASK